LARGARGTAGARLAAKALRACLCGRHRRHRVPVQRRDGGCSHSGSLRGGQSCQGEPLPYLFVCAFIANAASFVLPISNPANLVVFGSHLPPLLSWLAQFGLPSILSIGATYAALYLTQRRSLQQEISRDVLLPNLSIGGRLTACGIAITAPVLLLASAFDGQLGLPTFIAGTSTALVVFLRKREAPWDVLKDISWGYCRSLPACSSWLRVWVRPESSER